MPTEIRKRNLTPDTFRAFLAWLSPQKIDDGDAYEKARGRLILFFAGRQCREPETLADKTIDIAIQKIDEIPAEARPMAYLFGIAKNVFRDYLRETEKELRASVTSQTAQPAAAPDAEHRDKCLNLCLNQLPHEDRAILLNYYSQSKRAKIELHRELAEQHNLTPNALRNRVFRLNQRTRRCVNQCLENFTT
jgi:DNA-directed RNA polymerase specialized sigma24 family protein